MKRDFRTPRGGMIVALCVALIALWLVAVYGTYEESKREKYDVHITPGAVSYGTHSTAIVPIVTTSAHRTSAVPMVSGSTVRNYAHYGHASAPVGTSSSKGLYTTSSASVKHIGSGGGASGGGMMTSTGASSSRGISYGSASISMPTLALSTSVWTSSVSAAEASSPRAIGPRRVIDNGDGTYTGETHGEYYNGKWWDEDAEDWSTTPFDGAIKIEGGKTYRYDSTAPGDHWVLISDQGDPTNPQPLGATPWLLMMLLACAYALRKLYYNKKSK